MMLGRLHIEMSILTMIGHPLDAGGWSGLLADGDITTSGRAQALTGAAHVKQYTLCTPGNMCCAVPSEEGCQCA